jgi:predicted DNA-binding transcriptional regulator YafY
VTSATQLNRMVTMVSELTRRSRTDQPSASLDELAERFDATRSQIQADIRALTLLGDDPDADWLLSLSIGQEGDRISIASGGPFRRPIRFTGDELVALQLGLAAVEQSDGIVSSAVAGLLNQAEPVSHTLAGRGRVSPSLANLVRTAIRDRQKLEIRYTGERTLGGINRVVHPYQVLEQEGFTYVVAWCELAGGWRHFRSDRILDAVPAGHYAPRPDFTRSEDSFAEPPEATPVQVRFSPAIARWLRERHPDATSGEDGSLVVTYPVASPEWLLRHVLQYGPEAEIIAPASFRDLMRSQLSAP